MKLIDLSFPFDPQLFPNDESAPHPSLTVTILRTADGKKPGGAEITLNDHIGTHLDAPLHLVPGGLSIEQIPFDRFYGTGVVLDIPKASNEGVTELDLRSAPPGVESEDVVLISTGWDARLTKSDYASHHPYLTEDAARWLVSKRVKLIGMDVQSVDLPHSLRPADFSYTSLRILLEAEIPVLHTLTNLRDLHGGRYPIFALPIVFSGADGAPTRVVAQI